MLLLAVLSGALLAACGGDDKKQEPIPPAEPAPGTYRVKLETTEGDIVIEVHRDWAPIGADHFLRLVKAGYYDDCAFFRIVRNFVVQWGVNSDPAVTKRWINKNIRDDPVLKSNKQWYVTFGTTGPPNTRSTHVFINLKRNYGLDRQGFAPFGEVVEGREVVGKLYSGYASPPDQTVMAAQGRAYLQARFPKLDYIKKATVVE